MQIWHLKWWRLGVGGGGGGGGSEEVGRIFKK
jgi:hypothetical protein